MKSTTAKLSVLIPLRKHFLKKHFYQQINYKNNRYRTHLTQTTKTNNCFFHSNFPRFLQQIGNPDVPYFTNGWVSRSNKQTESNPLSLQWTKKERKIIPKALMRNSISNEPRHPFLSASHCFKTLKDTPVDFFGGWCWKLGGQPPSQVLVMEQSDGNIQPP